MSFLESLRTIVVAVGQDGQPGAALEYARKIAAAYNTRIVLSYGIDPVEYAALDQVPADVMEGLTEQARSALAAMADSLIRDGIHAHTEVRQGAIVRMLGDLARQHEAGLIVVGTRGSEGAGALAVGAVAERLVRFSACPVLAIAEDWNAGKFRPSPGGPIMLAIEANEAARAAAAVACSLAERFKRTLVAIHARGSDAAAEEANPQSALLARFGILPGGRFPVRVVVKDGPAADVIAAASAQYHPGLLVAGVKRASGTAGPHGTAFALLSRARVPVMCVPPDPGPLAAGDESHGPEQR